MRPFVVSGCLTAVTDMAAVSLFWRSSGVLLGSSGVLLGSSVLSNARRTPEGTTWGRRRTPSNKTPEIAAYEAGRGGVLFLVL